VAEPSETDQVHDTEPIGDIARLSEPHAVEIVDAVKVDRAVGFLNSAMRESGIQLAVRVSDYVVSEFFGGDVVQLDSRDRTKAVSYNALCRHPDLQIGEATLRRLARVGIQVRQLPDEVAGRLSQRHHRALLTVDDPRRKEELARAAVVEDWSPDKLAGVIAVDHQTAKPRTGRPAAPHVVKAISAVTRAVEGLGPMPFT